PFTKLPALTTPSNLPPLLFAHCTRSSPSAERFVPPSVNVSRFGFADSDFARYENPSCATGDSDGAPVLMPFAVMWSLPLVMSSVAHSECPDSAVVFTSIDVPSGKRNCDDFEKSHLVPSASSTCGSPHTRDSGLSSGPCCGP